ncbi:hypothetical protein Tco_0153288 [Tanacetum coccineum]
MKKKRQELLRCCGPNCRFFDDGGRCYPIGRNDGSYTADIGAYGVRDNDVMALANRDFVVLMSMLKFLQEHQVTRRVRVISPAWLKESFRARLFVAEAAFRALLHNYEDFLFWYSSHEKLGVNLEGQNGALQAFLARAYCDKVVMHVEFGLMGTECTLATVLAPRTGGYGGDASGGSNRPMVLPERLRLAYIPKEDTEPAEDTNSSIDDDKDYILLLQYGLSRLCRYNTVVVYYGDPSTNTGARDVGCMTSMEMLCVLYPPRKDL